jgi:small-conductance mechanosensitive channel
MRRPRNLFPIVLGLLLAACLAAVFWSAGPGAAPAAPAKSSAAAAVDQQLLQTAQQLAALADTADEQVQARDAIHLADQEIDQAFATALRTAAAAPPPASGPLRTLADRIARLKPQIAAEQTRLAQLTKDSAASPKGADAMQLAQAQLSLDQDDLANAQRDLARQGGDPEARLERALQRHQSEQQQPISFPKIADRNSATMRDQIGVWLSLRSKQEQLQNAARQATQQAAALLMQQKALEAIAAPASAPASAAATDPETVLARLRQISDQRKTLAEFDRRGQAAQQLTAVYETWNGLVGARRRATLHSLLRSLALILAILLVLVLADRAVLKAFSDADRKRLHQLRLITAVAADFSAAILILLVVFGPPTQITTFLGLATAGLAVVMKDFIVSFFGWFALMGRNGVRVGDWVEIDGISGEVIDIGLLKTVLLEVGNWAESGHPTGRQVSFANSYALENHWFNFSTKGQWLWDELQATVPPAGDPYHLAEEIRAVVEAETQADTVLAEQDWEQVTHQYGVHPFSAKPVVDLRPGLTGLDVKVRYITRAHERFGVRSRLFEKIVGLLRQHAT